MDRSVRTFLWVFLAGGLALGSASHARAAQQESQDPQNQPDQSKTNTKNRQKSDKKLRAELEPQYKKWLDEDVVYIISSEERRSFLHLATNEEREQFIEAFWQRQIGRASCRERG